LLSKTISAVGHPIVLGTLASLYVNFREFESDKAWWLSFSLLTFCILPLVIYLLYKIRKGVYKDFDVSDQSKRPQLYVFALAVLSLFVFYLYFTDSSWLIRTGIIPVFLLVLGTYLINKRIKVSLHTSFSFLLAVMMIKVDTTPAFSMFLFATLIGYSRLYLKRHSIPEVALGAALGMAIGFTFHFIYQLR
jgi:membrane-associated phospholipid phosphatase